MSDTRSINYPDKLVIRVPDGMRERIKRVAEENERSINSELVNTLLEEYPEVIIDPEVILGAANALNHIASIKDNEEKKELLEAFKKINEEKKLSFTLSFDNSGNIKFKKI